MEKFNRIISKLLHSKKDTHVNLSFLKEHLWEELSNEVFLGLGKKWTEKDFLNAGERYCKIRPRSFCNEKHFSSAHSLDQQANGDVILNKHF